MKRELYAGFVGATVETKAQLTDRIFDAVKQINVSIVLGVSRNRHALPKLGKLARAPNRFGSFVACPTIGSGQDKHKHCRWIIAA